MWAVFWPPVLVLLIVLGPIIGFVIGQDFLVKKAYSYRDKLLEKRKTKKLGLNLAIKNLPLPYFNQKSSDYRTPVSCSECGK